MNALNVPSGLVELHICENSRGTKRETTSCSTLLLSWCFTSTETTRFIRDRITLYSREIGNVLSLYILCKVTKHTGVMLHSHEIGNVLSHYMYKVTKPTGVILHSHEIGNILSHFILYKVTKPTGVMLHSHEIGNVLSHYMYKGTKPTGVMLHSQEIGNVWLSHSVVAPGIGIIPGQTGLTTTQEALKVDHRARGHRVGVQSAHHPVSDHQHLGGVVDVHCCDGRWCWTLK